MTQSSPYPVQPYLTTISLAYKNPALIADLVLPRVPVGAQDFKYKTYGIADAITIPNTLVGRSSRTPEVQFGASDASASTVDYGLESPIPYADIENARAEGNFGFDPQANATQIMTDLILLGREKRVADLVMNPANYPTANKLDLTTTHQWDDFEDGDPLADILNAQDKVFVRPNVLLISRPVFSVLSQHPKIVAAAFPTGAKASVGGRVGRQALANLFELDEVLVGEAWLNTARMGQDPVMTRVWTDDVALLFNRNNLATADLGVSFGVTGQWQQRVVSATPDNNIGLRGGVRVRVGESVAEFIMAPDLAFAFLNPLS